MINNTARSAAEGGSTTRRRTECGGIRWCRCVVTLFASLFVLMVSANVATWQSARKWATIPSAQVQTFELPDFLIGVLPYKPEFENLANVLLIASGCVLLCLVVFVVRDSEFIVDALWLETCCVLIKAIAQAVTTLPDVNLQRPVCRDRQFASPGWWIVSRVTATFCGDMLWSGHTSHMILVHVFLLRGVWMILSPPLPNRIVLPLQDGFSLNQEPSREHKMLFSMVSEISATDPTTIQTPRRPTCFPASPALFRCFFGFSFCLCLTVCLSLLLSRVHYSVDIFFAVLGTLGLSSHPGFTQAGRRWLMSKIEI